MKLSQEAKDQFRTTLTICNLMIGTSLLALPYSFMRLGYPTAFTLTLLAVAYTLFGFNYIIDACYYTQCQTLSDMLTGLFGKYFSIFVEAFIVFQYFGYLISYVSICADYTNIFIISVANYNFSTIYIKIIIFVLLTFLLIFKSLKSISNLSAVQQIFVVIAVICVIVFYGIAVSEGSTVINIGGVEQLIPLPNKSELARPEHTKGKYIFLELVQRIPLFLPLFGCQASLPIVYNIIPGDGDYKRRILKRAVIIGTIVTCTLCVFMAFFCLFLFGKDIQTNVLLSFSPKNYTMTTVRLLYAMVVLLTYVVVTFPIRGMFMKIFKQNKDTTKGYIIYVSLGGAMALFSSGFSILVPDILKVFNIVSSVFGFIENWILPVLFLYKHADLKEDYEIKMQQRSSLDQSKMDVDESKNNVSIDIQIVSDTEIKKPKRKINVKKLVGLCIACFFIVLVNLSAFVLTTFFDMTNPKYA